MDGELHSNIFQSFNNQVAHAGTGSVDSSLPAKNY